jgi:predicted dehydrogenase
MINAAIVGLGWWGQVLVNSVQGKSKKIKFMKASTRTLSKAKEFASEHAVDLVSSYEEVLADPNVDAVVLATPHSMHRAQVEAAAAAGKHILCEKPFTLFKADAEAASAAAKAAGVVLAIGQNRRVNPAFLDMKRRIAENWFGNVLHVEANFSAPGIWQYTPGSWRVDRDECPGGGMTGLGVHLIDAIVALLGEVECVYGQSRRVIQSEGLDEMTSAMLTLKSGVSAYLSTSVATEWCFTFRIIGENGWVESQNIPMDSMLVRPRGKDPEDFKFEPFDMQHAELETFADAINGTADYPVTTEEAIHVISVMRSIFDSIESGAPVNVS